MSLRKKLVSSKPAFKATVMPDFFLDYIISFQGGLGEMTDRFEDVAKRGGGNLLGWKHTIGRGGKASNFAAQLGKLGAYTAPIIETDILGRTLLSNFDHYLHMAHTKTDGQVAQHG